MNTRAEQLPSIQRVTPDEAKEWVSQKISRGSLILALYFNRSELEALLSGGEQTLLVNLDLPNGPSKSINGVMTSY